MFSKQILEPILASIKKCSNRNAFLINKRFYTYKQFSEYVSKIRIALCEIDQKNKQVGLVINDDIETYASIIALWMEGKCYVPLHPNWPIDRCMDIIEQVEIDLLLDSSKEFSRYIDKTRSRILPSRALTYSYDCLDLKNTFSDTDLAYILFTSGSTGQPKGAMLTRKNVAAFMDSFWKSGIHITEEDRCLQCFDLSFDVSVQGYLVPLTKGACCYTVPLNHVKFIYTSGLIEDHKLTFGAIAPSMLRYIKPYFREIDATSLKTTILTAEACPLDLMEDWYKCAINTEIYDFYGPTEATIYCSYYKLSKEGNNKSLNGIISIGKPMSNVIGLIFDENENELPTGEKGELCVSGDQVTAGYWNSPEKNKISFFNKDVNGKNLRFYHTGDLCFKDNDGDIMYCGRLDHQVKIQGYRVELGEIEFHARSFLQGINVACMAFINKDCIEEIAIFIESEEFKTDALVGYLNAKIPSYMVPGKIVFVPVFPLNGNEKIDKPELKRSYLI